MGPFLKAGDLVIVESTVYPGVTEDICVPLLEESSGQKANESFFYGYSPERINPGDKEKKLSKVVKLIAGSTEATTDKMRELYEKIVSAGTYTAKSIQVAEAAKVIENIQRDVNIALINELAILFEKISLDTTDVLDAASSKWNFQKYTPGLVGGHCIGVDPFYLTHKASEVGYHPEMILSGRRVNDSMANFVAQKLIDLMNVKGIATHGSSVLIMGASFKENCADIRNSKVGDVCKRLLDLGVKLKYLILL